MQWIRTFGWTAALGAAVAVSGVAVTAQAGQSADGQTIAQAEGGKGKCGGKKEGSTVQADLGETYFVALQEQEQPRRGRGEGAEGRRRGPAPEGAEGRRRGPAGEGAEGRRPGPGGEGRPAPGEGRGFNRGAAGGPAIAGLLRQVELTEEQAPKVRQILQDYQQATAKWNEENREAIEKHQAEVREAMQAGDREKAQQLRREFQEKNVAEREAKLRADIMAVLTPEQKQRLETLEKEREERMRQMRERRAGGEGAEGRPQRAPRGEGAEGERPRRQRGEGRPQRGEGRGPRGGTQNLD